MLQFPSSLSAFSPLGQVAESWVTAWLTPIWFLATGIAIGLGILLVLMLLFRILSAIGPWEALSHSPLGHVVAGVISVVIAAGVWFGLSEPARGQGSLQEPLLLGIAILLMCAIAGWSLVFCSSRQAAKSAFATISEGAAGFLGVCALVIVFLGACFWGYGFVGSPIIPDPQGAFASIPHLFSTGVNTITKEIEAAPADGVSPLVPVDVDINFDLLERLEVSSDTSVLLADNSEPALFTRPPIRLGAKETLIWSSSQKIEDLPIPVEDGTQLHIQNNEIDPTTVTIYYRTRPPVPEAMTLFIGAITVVLIGLSLLLQQAVAPRVSAVAHATVKNELGQPLFLVLMVIGIVAVILFEFLSFNTFGEDIKLLKDCGITTIMLLAAFQGIWSASSSVSEEIEGKTALTVLSKPIQRRSFVIGKFMGIFWVLMLIFVVLGSIELGAVSYKPLYDAREASQDAPTWQVCHAEMVSTIPGLAMAFMQAVVLTAVSVALATRLPQFANLSICFAIYVIGNLTTSLVSSTQDQFEIVKFVASLVSTIVPVLEHFSLQAAIDADRPLTLSLLSGNLVYCLLYVMVAMFLALLLFEDRDLA